MKHPKAPLSRLSCAIAAAVMLMTAASSCTGDRNDSDRATSYGHRIAANLTNRDSLLQMRDQLSENENPDVRQRLYDLSCDSTAHFQAAVMVLTMRPDQIAGIIVREPRTGLAAAVAGCYHLMGLDGEYARLRDQTLKNFDGMDTASQAQLVTAIATPEQCAAAVQQGDDALVREIRLHYKGTDSLRRFDSALARNSAYDGH